MTDRELLEQAAKSAGINLVYDWGFMSSTDKGLRFWNPLTDDGDALRLAVKLELDAAWYEKQVYVDYIVEQYDNDPYAATRRAIVRAAAEIGKGMK